MSHYAKVNNGIVEKVIVAEADFFNNFVDTSPGAWIQTSYNTRNNIHYGPDGQPDGGTPFRGNYAGIGFIYDAENNVFYAPQPYPSWTLDTSKWAWNPPTPMPSDAGTGTPSKIYHWNESTLSWVAQ